MNGTMNYQRYYIPNSIVFVTQIVHTRSPVFENDEIVELLRETLRNVKELHPFVMLGYVFLPDHFHLLFRPTGDSNFSQIMHSLKPNFTKVYKELVNVSGRMKFWQRRFYDHIIRDEIDLHHHLDYIHYNPVKHGLVNKPEDWQHSSFLAWKKRGACPNQWGWNDIPQTINGLDLE